MEKEFYIYVEKYFHRYFQYLFSSEEVLNSIKAVDKDLYYWVEAFREAWLKEIKEIFNKAGLPLSIAKNTEEILTFFVEGWGGAFLADLCHIPDFLLPPSFKNRYPNLGSRVDISFKKVMDKVSAYSSFEGFRESYRKLWRKEIRERRYNLREFEFKGFIL
ncbi:MAG: hypothetical protein RMJ17_01985 [Candidatus Aenigmarchaeota archaeon]|nr:hypothetical protein [Candidatus Aenigmarchaeota archaeon]MDW8149345.1 hypothetical protein [Candidatus Aenigmarchaeota archaeon]